MFTCMRANTESFTVLPTATATDEHDVFTYWRFSPTGRTTLAMDALRSAWVNRGLSTTLLPEMPSDDKALTRAARFIEGRYKYEQGVLIITPIFHRKPRMVELVVIKKVTDPDGEPGVTTFKGLKVFVGEQGELKHMGEDPMGILSRVNARYEACKTELDSSDDLSGWMTSLACETLSGIPVHPNGATYLLLAPFRARWTLMCEALKEALPSSDVFKIPAVRDENTMKAILTALTEEMVKFTERTSKELEGKNRSDGLANKAKAAQAAKAKIALFEKVLETSLGDLHTAVDTLNQTIVSAKAAAYAAKANGN